MIGVLLSYRGSAVLQHRLAAADLLQRQLAAFVVELLAYANRPLPIGYGQTISLPVGTGSGYQAAVLAELGHQVYTIEIVSDLAEQAATRLSDLGYDAVHVRQGDGYYGWLEAAPFDGIVVAAPALRGSKDRGQLVSGMSVAGTLPLGV